MLKKLHFLFLIVTFFSIKAQNIQNSPNSNLSPFLSRAYYNINFGTVFYPFSNANLNEGYSAKRIHKNVFSGRLLLGYKIDEKLSIQFGVMRPAAWFQYSNINGEANENRVWINLWSLSAKHNFRIFNKTDFFVELGVGNITRKGFSLEEEIVYSDAHYLALVTGAGVQHKLNKNWNLLLSGLYLPKSESQNQPYTFQSSLGLQYNLKSKSTDTTEMISLSALDKYFFPQRVIQIGYGTSKIGFFFNKFFSLNARIGDFKSFGIPIFWNGTVQAANTVTLAYQETAYHGEKLFSLDWGLSITGFETVGYQTKVFAFSIFPVMKFFIIRVKPLDLYIQYSVIGPTFISKKNIDGEETGPQFTYQDFMGFGLFLGEKRNVNLDFKIMHYSNGNIFTKNAGVAIPIVFSIGTNL